MSDTAHMSGNPCVQCRVSPEIKARLRAAAKQQQVTESVLLKRLVELALLSSRVADSPAIEPPEPATRNARVFVRLRPEDHALLRERAVSREMAAATYASIVLRMHLRGVQLLPDRELRELKRSVAELGAIGRNLNQIARVAQQSGRVAGPSSQELHALLRACAGLRDHVKELMRANTASWETGYVEPSNR
jgi:predicted HicB family RNase H-like nuclease